MQDESESIDHSSPTNYIPVLTIKIQGKHSSLYSTLSGDKPETSVSIIIFDKILIFVTLF